MGQLKNVFSTRWGIISVGAFIGVFAPLLQKFPYACRKVLSIVQRISMACTNSRGTDHSGRG